MIPVFCNIFICFYGISLTVIEIALSTPIRLTKFQIYYTFKVILGSISCSPFVGDTPYEEHPFSGSAVKFLDNPAKQC